MAAITATAAAAWKDLPVSTTPCWGDAVGNSGRPLPCKASWRLMSFDDACPGLMSAMDRLNDRFVAERVA
jgi:hypothetical protein